MTDTTSPASPLVTARQARLVHRLATLFYGLAASAAVVGQTWVAVDHLPWPAGMPPWLRVATVVPFTLTVELLAVVLAVMSDYRMRLGERAVAVRVMSAVVAVIATGVIVLGHGAHDPYLATAFGALSASAYLLALIHMGMRRRDALRAAGLLAAVPPSYGLGRWLRHPRLTARAAELARVHGLGLRESWVEAERELRAERRRPAIAAAVEQAIRAAHPDPRMARIAVSTLDLDRIAEVLEQRADYGGWAARLSAAVTAPPETDMSASESGHGADAEVVMSAAESGHDRADMSASKKRTRAGRRGGQKQPRPEPVTADDLRELMQQRPDMTQRQLAELVGLSDRQVRRILRGAGADMPALSGGHVRLNGHAMSG